MRSSRQPTPSATSGADVAASRRGSTSTGEHSPSGDDAGPSGERGEGEGPYSEDGPDAGRQAERPQAIPARGWKQVLRRTKDEAKRDNLALLAAGVAFYALLSLVPALVALVSVYGLAADPTDIQRQVSDVLSAAPAEVRELVGEQLTSITEGSESSLGATAVIGIILALWSASSGMKHLMSAVNVAYDEEESRGFLALRGTALGLTLGAVVFFLVAVATIAAAPALVADTALGTPARVAVSILRWPVLGAGLMFGLAVLYRYGPDRDQPKWAWTGPGTIVATVAWLVASIAFSVYTANFGSYGETYGSLGAVVVLMLWLMISAAAVILGAEINAESERQTAEDTTAGAEQPMGARNAYAADTLGS